MMSKTIQYVKSFNSLLHILCPSGTIHDDLHSGNIICLDNEALQEKRDHTGPGACREEIFSQFGIIDFGDITESCCVFDLAIFLHALTQGKETPPKEYVEYMNTFTQRMKNKTNDEESADKGDNVSNDTNHPGPGKDSAGHADMLGEGKEQKSTLDQSSETLPEELTTNEEHPVLSDPSGTPELGSHETDGLVLAGHAIAGYLTASSLTELEWEVLLPAVCARYIILFVIIRQILARSNDNIESNVKFDWNCKKALKRLVSLGKDAVNVIWRDICKGYGITC